MASSGAVGQEAEAHAEIGNRIRRKVARSNPGGDERLSMIEAIFRPGYTTLAAALKNGLAPDEWDALVKDTLRLPLRMLPAVQIAMSKGVWRNAHDPLK